MLYNFLAAYKWRSSRLLTAHSARCTDSRQRNARLELSNANADPDALLAALHAERDGRTRETEKGRRGRG